jgi:MFS family permease
MMFLFNGDFPRLILSFTLYGVSYALVNSAAPALRADLVPRDLRGKVIGSQSFMNMLLSATGLLISGVLYEFISPHFPFLLYTVITFPNIFLTWFLIQEPVIREK